MRYASHSRHSAAATLAIAFAAACWSHAGVARAAAEPSAATTASHPGLCLASGLQYGAAPLSGTIGAAGEVDCYGFTAEAGARVRARVVATSGALTAHVQINGSACGSITAPEVTCTPGSGGTYAVTVRDAAGSQTGGYALSLQRLDDPVGCSSLAFGVTTRTGAITAGETECWRFTAAPGDRVRLRLVTAASGLSPRAEVLRPDGTTRCAPVAAGDSTCQVDAGGEHTILVRDVAAGTGGYSLSIQRLADPAGCTSKSFGPTATAGTITTTGEADCWRFAGTAGNRVRVRLVRMAGALDPTVEVLRPNGTTRCAPSRADDVTCQLDVTGTHTVLVRDFAGTFLGDYRIGLQRLDDPVGCSSFAYGTAVHTGSLGTPGEADCWRFSGAGDRILLRVIPTSGAWSPIAEVVGASGSTDCAAAHGATYVCRLSGATQARTLLVRDALGPRTGDYRVSIQRLNAPIGCSGEPGLEGVDGFVVVAGVDCQALEGEAGDLLRIRLIDGGYGWDPVVEVERPDGTSVCHRRGFGGFDCRLDADGPHAIVVRSAAGTVYGGYRISSIRLNDAPSNCPNLAASPGPHTASILHDAEVDCYTTWAPEAGARELRVRATSGTLEPVVEVLRPDGSLRCLRTDPEDWFDCYGDIYEYQRVLVYDATGTKHGNYEIDRR